MHRKAEVVFVFIRVDESQASMLCFSSKAPNVLTVDFRCRVAAKLKNKLPKQLKCYIIVLAMSLKCHSVN